MITARKIELFFLSFFFILCFVPKFYDSNSVRGRDLKERFPETSERSPLLRSNLLAECSLRGVIPVILCVCVPVESQPDGT